MFYHLYILYSKKFNRFYVGVTNNLIKRLSQHNNKEIPSTAGGTPWTLIWSITKPTLREAESLKQKLKHLSRDRKLKFMQKYNEGVVDQDLLQALSHLIKQ